LGLTHFASTLLVCGGFLLLAPADASAADVVAARTFGFEIVTSPDTPRDHQLSGGALDTDLPDSSDDDDDDDVVGGGGDAVIAVGSCHAICSGEASSPVHIEVESWVSHTMEGYFRGRRAAGSSDADRVIDLTLTQGACRPPRLIPSPLSRRLVRPTRPAGRSRSTLAGWLGRDVDSSDDDGTTTPRW
jgi:hypothetical protein